MGGDENPPEDWGRYFVVHLALALVPVLVQHALDVRRDRLVEPPPRVRPPRGEESLRSYIERQKRIT